MHAICAYQAIIFAGLPSLVLVVEVVEGVEAKTELFQIQFFFYDFMGVLPHFHNTIILSGRGVGR
jgi:hypothetical protein